MPSTIEISGAGSVPAEYEHVGKLAVPGEPLVAAGAALKWYDVHRDDAPTPAAVQREAREFLLAEAQAGSMAFDDELGFVELHRCSDSFYFLLVCTWRVANEVWETIYYKDGACFALFPREGPHKGTFCVWELGVILHERAAWTRFLRSGRDAAAVEAYMADRFAGPV